MNTHWDCYFSKESYIEISGSMISKYKEPTCNFDKITIVKRAVLFLPFYLKYIICIRDFNQLCDELYNIFFSYDPDQCIEPKKTMIVSLRHMNHGYIIKFITNVCMSYANPSDGSSLPKYMMDSSDYYNVAIYLIGLLNNNK